MVCVLYLSLNFDVKKGTFRKAVKEKLAMSTFQKNNKNLKVLHVYKVLFDQEGGIPALIRQITGINKSNIRNKILIPVTIKHIKKKEDKDLKNIPIYKTLSFGNLFSMPIAPLFPIAFWTHIKNTDIVDYHYPFPLVDLSIFLWFPKGKKLIIHWHADIEKQKKLLRIISPLIKRTLKRADKIIVSNPAIITHSKLLSPFKKKCTIIPYGVPNYWLQPPTKRNVEKIHAKNPNFILAVGRLVKYKGFDVLIESMQNVPSNLIIIGTGIELLSLKNLAKKYGVSNKVIFKGKLSDDDLKCYYHACKFFVFPSTTEAEAFGLVQLEAMSCKKTIINTQLNSAVPWIARHGYEALTVPKNDPTSLSNAINLLLNDENLIKKMGELGHHRVIKHFSNQLFIKETYRLYQKVIEPQGED